MPAFHFYSFKFNLDRDLDVFCVFTNRTFTIKISCFISFITQNLNDILQIDTGNNIQTLSADQSIHLIIY